jgi:tetratricopeptide (TPR) repeat protein
LISPLEGYRLGLTRLERDRVSAAYSALALRGAFEAARSEATELLARNPDLDPAVVLLAQTDFLAADTEAVIERLRPIAKRLPDYLSCQLLLGRAAEQSERIALAFVSYSSIAGQSRVATERAGQLRARALEIFANRVRDAIGRNRLQQAADHLGLMERWAPEDQPTLESVRLLAVAEGDRTTELAAVRKLTNIGAGDRQLLIRQADLELEIGDASAGLRIAQGLADRYPDDPGVVAQLARAKFLWRVGLLPEKVRELSRLPLLDRAEFAAVVYWLFPSVRYGRSETGTIANDILENPHRQEIVRVINLGVMSVDPNLHRFDPEQELTRSEALAALLRILDRQGTRLTCLGVADLSGPTTIDATCSRAARCGLISEPGECLPQANISGSVALEMSRAALEQLGVE